MPIFLAWRIPWTEEPGGLQSMESWSQTQQRNEHLWGRGWGGPYLLHLLCLPHNPDIVWTMQWMFTACSFVSFQLLWEKLNPRKRSLSLKGMGTMKMVQEVYGLGEGTALHWKRNFKGFIENNTACPLPATWNSTSSVEPESFLGRMGESLISHTCSLLQCKPTQGLASWNGPDVGPFQSSAGSLAAGGSGAWLWPFPASFTVCPWVVYVLSLSPGFCICEWGLIGCLRGLCL